MRWSDYYEKINDWSVSTAVSKISSLEDMGAPDELSMHLTSLLLRMRKELPDSLTEPYNMV